MSEAQSTLWPETRVGHVRDDAGAVEVYVGRGTIWGNPFVPRGRAALSRFPVTESDDPLGDYEAHVRSRPDLMARLPELRGRVLGCYCVRLGRRARTERCHAQVLARLADAGAGPTP